MMSPILYWYRQDLRIHDLPGLAAAAATGRPLIPCYILDDRAPGHWRAGAASRWWLHHSLTALAADLERAGGCLVLRRGDTIDELLRLARETGARDIFCSRMYEPWAVELEEHLHARCKADGIEVKRHRGVLLHEPETISTQSGGPYKVFTPFWRACVAAGPPVEPKSLPEDTRWSGASVASDILPDWQLCPEKPDWASAWRQWWTPGSCGAFDKLQAFLQTGIEDYTDGRDFPALERTSRLSPHLHYGEISPAELWHRVHRAVDGDPALAGQAKKFLGELGWREFSYHLLHHFPSLPEQPFKEEFGRFPWQAGEQRLRAWQRGETGYPLVDAGMRELWHTGYMHNRVRMIVASFLTKHLLIHWRKGADWFWDTLVDADLANNSASWQWVAGSGADASPYFRIFNPVVQGKKFDCSGAYIRQWIPELADLPDRRIHAPWEAPHGVLEQAGIRLGDTYPRPIVEHKRARENALAAYASLDRQHNDRRVAV